MASYIDNRITCQRPTDNYKILKLLNRQVQTFSYLSEECNKWMSIQLPTASHKTDRNSVSSRYHYISAWNKKTQRCMEINPKASKWYERRWRYFLWSVTVWAQSHRRKLRTCCKLITSCNCCVFEKKSKWIEDKQSQSCLS